MAKCKWCDQPATEANGLCFSDAEENAVLTYAAFLEVTGDSAKAAAAAQKSWQGQS
jgi:hypothetical protein